MATLPTEPFGLHQSMPPTIGRNDHIPIWSVSHVIQILTTRLWLSPQHWRISTKRYATTLPQALQLLHQWFRFSKPIGKRSRFYHADTEERAQLHNPPVVTVRQPFSPQCLTLQKVRSMKSVSFAMLQAKKTWAWQTPQTLCWEDSLVADAAVRGLPGILLLPGITLPVPLQSKNEQSIDQLLPCWKNISTCITCASSMSFQSCQLVGRSCINPVQTNHHYGRKGRHAGVSQWPLWENHSLHSLNPRQSSD